MKDACCPSTEQTTKMIYDTILTTPVKKKKEHSAFSGYKHALNLDYSGLYRWHIYPGT